ncbi:hypothetical protein Baya_9813 [Bagarius yarrelli]|uniref:Uncharacterized protein n=1 Tax=Bagarius yarrelli TaxID=175774 RepID=A0A556U8E0_BAGYA|nr:hypothetical protein Baya_9813 [Bagarius yarrelli]
MVKGQKLALVFIFVQIYWTCGQEDFTQLNQYTARYLVLCSDACRLHNNKYFWCSTDKGWDYCSPSHDVTYRNELCRSDHWCHTHGYSYSWCWTESSWDYCGLTELYNPSKRQKRQPNNIIEICSVNDPSNKKVTSITAEPNDKAIRGEKTWKTEINKIISQWNNSYLGNQARSELTTTKKLRIDLQQLVKRKNKYYYNLQIQLNTVRKRNKSTTLAQVLTPQGEDVPERYIRRAFIESFNHQARVFVDVSHGNVPAKQGQKCD